MRTTKVLGCLAVAVLFVCRRAPCAPMQPASFVLWFTDNTAPPAELKFDPQAVLSAITLDVGIGERESFWVNVTPQAAMKRIVVSVSDLRGAKGAVISREKVRVREQREYKLYDATQWEGLTEGRSCRVWFTLEVRDAPPDIYSGTVTFTAERSNVPTFQRSNVQTLPLRVQVWNVRKPSAARVSLQPYSGAMGLLNGYPNINGSEGKPRTLALMRELGAGGGDWLDVFINPATFLSDVKVREAQTPVWTALAQSPETFRGRTLPRLDFSCYDFWIEEAIKAGLVRCGIHFGDFSSVMLSALRKLSGQQLEVGTPEWERYVVWLWGEFADYLKSRGYPEVWAKVSDEISPDEMERWRAAAALARQAGMRPYCTWTGFLARQRGALARLNPLCDQWQVQILSLHNFCQMNGQSRLIDDTDEVWTYGGGSRSFRIPYSGYRQYGWYAGHYGLRGYGFWVYYWWTAGEQVVYPEGEQVISTPAWEGVKDGHDDAEYFALLNAMMEQSRERVQRGAAAAERDALKFAEAERRKLIGTDARCFLRLQPDVFSYGKSISYPWHRLTNGTTPNFRQAKARLLALIERLQPFYRASVFYGPTPLVRQGRAAALITQNEKPTPAEREAIAALVARVQKLSGVRLPVKVMDDLTTEEKERHTLIQIGKPANAWRLREYAIDPGRTDQYPAAGNYVIRAVPSLYNPLHRVIIIAGADDAGTRRGVENFARVLK